MNFGLRGKKVVVTGGSRGLGRSIVTALANEGAIIAVIARDSKELRSIIVEIGGEKAGHIGIALDLMQENAGLLLKEQIINGFGWPDIVIHNVGGTLGIRDTFSSSNEYEQVWRFNVGVAMELNNIFVPHMKQKKWGRIVHISSIAAVTVDASLPYCVAKASLNAYVKGLGREVAKFGIIANAVMPGPIIFDGGHWDMMAKEKPEIYQKFLLEKMPGGKIGKPEEISSLVTFLCSEQATYFAGAILAADGGIK